MKNKGFTLIELLAVIIILGILMIIAIPSVTRYISDSRKSAYVDTANALVSGARNMVNDGRLQMFDTNTTYYINAECIKTEGANKSPYGEFVKAYVVVTYNGKGYEYYWTSIDEVGSGVKKITKLDKLTEDSIESDLKTDDIKDNIGIDGRSKYVKIDKSNNCNKSNEENVSSIISGETGDVLIIYPDGKDKDTVEYGDEVKIGTEEFYVIGHSGNNLMLLAKYNLKVGYVYNYHTHSISKEYTSSDPGYGIQSAEVYGYNYDNDVSYGVLPFSIAPNNNYWVGKIGTTYPGKYCTNSDWTGCAFVYDSHSNLYQYVNNYKSYLESLGVSIKEARILKLEESNKLKNTRHDIWNSSTYWTGTVINDEKLFTVPPGTTIFFTGYEYYTNTLHGVRPVIII